MPARKAGATEPLMDFTPSCYWKDDSEELERPTNQYRRRLAYAKRTGDWSNVKDPAIAFAERGGDFLPEFMPGEVEIARLALESTTWDVISIRARPSSRGILYRVVDEYESTIPFHPKSSRRPLSFGRLIQAIDGLTECRGAGMFRPQRFWMRNWRVGCPMMRRS